MIEKGKRATPPATTTPTACQVCGAALGDGAVVHCSRCKTPHHEQCWRYNKGCSTYGCGHRTCVLGVSAAPPAPDVVLRLDSETLERAYPRCLWAFCAGLLMISVVGVAPGLLVHAPHAGAGYALPWLATIAFLAFLLAGEQILGTPTLLELDPGRCTVDRVATFWGWDLWREAGWLARSQIVELHAYGSPVEEVVAVLVNGEIRTLLHPGGIKGTAASISDLERLASWAERPVVDYRDRPRPTGEQLREIALAARLLEDDPSTRASTSKPSRKPSLIE